VTAGQVLSRSFGLEHSGGRPDGRVAHSAGLYDSVPAPGAAITGTLASEFSPGDWALRVLCFKMRGTVLQNAPVALIRRGTVARGNLRFALRRALLAEMIRT
jgi:hypothetical protein